MNRVSAKARAAGIPVIFIQHESEAGYLEFGTDAWQLAQGLHTEPSDIRVRKATPDSFLRTDLEAALRARAITDLIICGMHTEFCVDTTTRKAFALGYPVILVEDAHTEGNEYVTPRQVIQHHNATLTNISSFGPRVIGVIGVRHQFCCSPRKRRSCWHEIADCALYSAHAPSQYSPLTVLLVLSGHVLLFSELIDNPRIRGKHKHLSQSTVTCYVFSPQLREFNLQMKHRPNMALHTDVHASHGHR
ncbi:isochorismatase family protein [Polaromonas jejuensis]|uniref:Isochorismatase family protein n=1 Tax=Polaromonas jejuensis TaxID=457502 RepID=A0ABW0Q415_9BURK